MNKLDRYLYAKGCALLGLTKTSNRRRVMVGIDPRGRIGPKHPLNQGRRSAEDLAYEDLQRASWAAAAKKPPHVTKHQVQFFDPDEIARIRASIK